MDTVLDRTASRTATGFGDLPDDPELAGLHREILDTLSEFANDKRSMAPDPRRPFGGYYVASRRRRTARVPVPTAPAASAGLAATITPLRTAPRRGSASRWEAAHQLAVALGGRR